MKEYQEMETKLKNISSEKIIEIMINNVLIDELREELKLMPKGDITLSIQDGWCKLVTKKDIITPICYRVERIISILEETSSQDNT